MATDIEKLGDELSKLSILEASELVKMLEGKWDVKAASGGGMVMAAPAAGGGGAEAAAEKTEFDVELSTIGDKKIQVIKVVRELTGLGLKGAKDVVDGAPKMVKTGVAKADADAMKAKLEAVGATATIK
ncbi:MAG: 50S ribosomal protein L7/L12 [Deltaproteobacteria bacterium]|nr:50S ribosomal protein L7/L12 [Deltaproteobacteria bacterium]